MNNFSQTSKLNAKQLARTGFKVFERKVNEESLHHEVNWVIVKNPEEDYFAMAASMSEDRDIFRAYEEEVKMPDNWCFYPDLLDAIKAQEEEEDAFMHAPLGVTPRWAA